ncbi:hypothetical protein L1049_010770 [Liquidambar formosana]|uniref:Peptidase M48 domain-containing protein n=1 Tax=Liquidambar formosana TaxID=63359 RepID=A0AAP0N4V2_LIQFO
MPLTIIMGFCFIKSKLILFNEYGSFRRNNIVYSHQGLIQSEAIRGFNPRSRAVLTSVVNRVTMSSAMYLLGAKHIHSPALLKIGRRVYPYPLYLPMAKAVISREIIQALHSGLRLERECSVNGYAPKSAKMSKDICRGNSIASKYLGANGESKGKSRFEGEKVCLKVAQRSEKQAPKLIWKPATKHLDGMDWHMSDAQIATTIGHEVGHAVSWHYAEHWIKLFWAICLLSILSNFFPINHGHGKNFHLVQLWRSRRTEKEADYIGLMLMASAGYDPREAPKSYEDNFSKDSIFSTHPCGRTRAKLLNRTEVMEEALAIYTVAKPRI